MSTLPNGKLILMHSAARERQQDLARRAMGRLVAEAGVALVAVDDGDIDAIFTAHRALGRAVGVVLENRLSTSSSRRSGTCWQCGADVSQGRCWGCGAPPERVS